MELEKGKLEQEDQIGRRIGENRKERNMGRNK